MSVYFNQENLTTDEHAFLRQHGINVSSLFDARAYPATGWGDEARSLGIQFGIGKPCKMGHRIRARSGHCIVCRPMNIKYQSAHREPGYVYIASSRRGRIHKIGSTKDYQDREARLQRDGYAGFTDWVIIAWLKSLEAQRLEMELQTCLKDCKFRASYNKSTGNVDARELFGPDLHPIWSAFKSKVESTKKAKAWRHPAIVDFDFSR